MSKYTAKGLADFALAKANKPETIYVLGSFGQELTSSYLEQACNRLAWNQQSRGFLGNYVDQGIQAFDCVGLIKAYLWDDNPANYNPAQDRNEVMMYNDAKVKGQINTLPEVPGTLVFMEGHVGVYIGNGRVCECTPNLALGGWGVLNTALAGRGWTKWAQHIDIDYSGASSDVVVQPAPSNQIDQILEKGSKVTSVAMAITGVATVDGVECSNIPALGGYFPTEYISEYDASDGAKDGFLATTLAKVYVDETVVEDVDIARNLVMIHGIWVLPAPLTEI